MKKKMIIMWSALALLAMGNILQLLLNHSPLHSNAIPDEKTALRVAEAVIAAKYGEESLLIAGQTMTFDITTDKFGRAWIITGVFPASPSGYLPVGGVPEVIIRISDGKVLRITHGM